MLPLHFTIAFTLSTESYILAAITFALGALITCLICFSSKRASITTISTLLEAERNRNLEIKQELNSSLTSIKQAINPIAITLQRVEQQINQQQQTAATSTNTIKEQIQRLVETQQNLQKETTQLTETISQQQEQKQINIPKESITPIEPTDSLTGDDLTQDFSADALADQFEGFTADTPGFGI